MGIELRLPVVRLPGLAPDSLGNYLASLGLLRVLARKWPSTRIAWRDEVLQVVGGPSDLNELLDEMVGVASDRAWTPYTREWGDAQKQGTKDKSGVPLALWQARADEAQLTLFAAHAVPHARISFNPLLGTGGNAGRRDFAAGWQKAVDALSKAPSPTKGRGKNKAETAAGATASVDIRRQSLEDLLLGRPVTWMVEKLAAGSWFSEATKLYNSGQSPAREGAISPWAMVLACEGLSFIAGGASRRLGARSARAVGAFPFLTVPIAPQAEKEADRLIGEIWAPLWNRPMSLAEVSTLFSRGRAELRGRGSLSPAEFATAIRRRGVDAGISEFRRFTLGRTTSKNTFEPRLETCFALDAKVAAGIERTLARVTALIETPSFQQASAPSERDRLRKDWGLKIRGRVEAALLDVAARPSDPEAGIALLDALVDALDRLDRNRSLRECKIRWEPLPLEWLPSLFVDEPPGVEARLALSLVSAFPEALPFTAFRFGVEWARERGGRYAYDWATLPKWFVHAKTAPARWLWGPGELARMLSALLSRKLLEEAVRDASGTLRPPGRAPLPARMADVQAWFTGMIDERLLVAWLSRLALFDWRFVPRSVQSLARSVPDPAPVDGALAVFGLVQPLVDRRPLVLRSLSPNDLLADKTGARTVEAASSLVTLIRTGSLDAALRLASSRYAMAGARLAALEAPCAVQDPDRLAAALLFSITDRDRTALCKRWLRPRRQPHQGDTHA